MATDEGIDLLTSDRPSPNLLAFLEFLYREIAIGFGIPLEVVYKLSELGGATTRTVLEDAQWLWPSKAWRSSACCSRKNPRKPSPLNLSVRNSCS